MRHAHLLFFTDKNVVDHLQQNMWSVRQFKKKNQQFSSRVEGKESKAVPI
jgi:predicted oxidoreductase (fatty acid repression mutant protein)